VRLFLAVGGLLVGVAIGWWAGSFTACSRSTNGCETRVASIEALGTWVGGLGTVAAVMFAAVTFRNEERSRREAERRSRMTQLERERLDQDEAEQVSIRCQIGSFTAERVTEVRVHVHNGTNSTPLYKLRGRLERFGNLNTKHELEAGKTATKSFPMGYMGTTLPAVPVPLDERDEWLADLTSKVVIVFEMNGEKWMRTGNGPIERGGIDEPASGVDG
jgi:hypothetical protein